MVMNLVIDGVVGLVPLAGDLFDFAFKAHSRNHALLVQLARDAAPDATIERAVARRGRALDGRLRRRGGMGAGQRVPLAVRLITR